ncbi:hypothetical protein GGR95_003566 [Sulfitobacter undariae]|uniref:Sulfotransferase family protein n=1 Tax=Sulfitobacter undariae TaxID=1563671 RepID=A0A7W6H1T9_9RHOB|nr:hypothetical protein [Sulfitobacter undariae]MBB3995900.1 hypothetical protein [Sulfitobacter undariae]
MLKVLINSIPKSGTYFVGKLLDCAGMNATGYHLRNSLYWDWNRAETLDDVVRTPNEFLTDASLEETLGKIVSGFTYAHLNHNTETEQILEHINGLRHVFLYRNLRNSIVSSMRFVEQQQLALGLSVASQQTQAERLYNYISKQGDSFFVNAGHQVGWLSCDAVSKFRFEDIVESTCATKELLNACGWEGSRAKVEAIRACAIGERTRTSTGKNSDWNEYWSDEIEKIFVSSGAQQLNIQMGYEGDNSF